MYFVPLSQLKNITLKQELLLGVIKHVLKL